MKKLFSLLLCVVMVLSLVACGSKTDDTQTPDEPQDTAPELSGTMKVVATGDVYGPLFDAFTADTGVEVECLSMSSGEVSPSSAPRAAPRPLTCGSAAASTPS